jgi:hypothetical protein
MLNYRCVSELRLRLAYAAGEKDSSVNKEVPGLYDSDATSSMIDRK